MDDCRLPALTPFVVASRPGQEAVELRVDWRQLLWVKLNQSTTSRV